MMGRLNLYITKEFVLYFLSCLISLVVIALTFVVLGELSSLGEPEGTKKFFAAILESIPLLLELILPIAVLLGTILTYTSLSKTSETIAMQAAGVSLFQLIKPVLMVGLLIALGAYFNQSYLAPWWGAEKKLSFSRPKPPTTIWRFYQGKLYFFSQLNKRSHYAGSMGIIGFDQSYAVDSVSAVQGILQSGVSWPLGPGSQISLKGDQIEYVEIPKHIASPDSIPVAFNLELPYPKYTNFGSLIQSIQIKAQGAVSYSEELFALLQKISSLITILTMMLLALPFSLFTGRASNLRSGIVIAIVLGFVYWLVDQVFASLFDANVLSAWTAAFGANGIFLSLALFFLLRKLN